LTPRIAVMPAWKIILYFYGIVIAMNVVAAFM
jgi:hypothetical protein